MSSKKIKTKFKFGDKSKAYSVMLGDIKIKSKIKPTQGGGHKTGLLTDKILANVKIKTQ